MINQMNRFSPNLAQLSQPLRELRKYQAKLDLGIRVFEKLKVEITTPKVLAHYDVTADTKISCMIGSIRKADCWGIS